VKMKFLAPSAGALLAALVLYISAPPPHQASATFADQSTAGGTSTGSANAQAITIYNYASNLQLVPLRFIPGFTNNGPTTISVSGLPPVAILRPSSVGLVALSGQELLVGEPTSIIYNGANYVLASNLDMTKIGQTVEFRGPTAPRGTLIEDGSCVSQTTYAALFSVISTTYGTCSAGLFALPDSRGTAFYALDGQGANGLAGRITTASCATPNAVGLCGHDTQTLSIANINTFTPAVSSFSLNIPTQGQFAGGSTAANVSSANLFGLNNTSFQTNQITTGTINMAPLGSGTPHAILNPASLGRRAIKY
jgi:microcystin-dependent protein